MNGLIQVRPSGSEGEYSVFSPSSMTWGLNDISDSAAGRTMDGKMHKNLLCQKRTLALEWHGTTPEETSRILQAFNPEYIQVKFNDALTNSVVTKTFYTGDRNASVYRWSEKHYRDSSGQRQTVEMKYYDTISFTIIEV